MRQISTVLVNDKDYSASEAAEWMSMRHLEVIRRLRKGDIEGRKVGWFWVISGAAIAKAMKADWYKSRKNIQ